MINVTKLKQQLKQGIIKNIYLFYGEEKYLADNYIKRLADMAIGDGIREFNYSFYNEDNESFDALVNDIESYPTMSEKKVIVLKDVKFAKLKEYQKPLAELFSNLPDYAVVILAEAETSKIKKSLADIIQKNGEIVEFKKQSVADLRAWLTRELSKSGKQISSADAEYLINLCERSLEKLSTECGKLASSTEDGTITKEIIDSLVKVPVEYKIFEMSDKLLTGDTEGAYRILDGFKTSKVQPIVIFSVIYGQFSDLLMFKLLGNEKKNPAEFLAPNKKWLANKLSAECAKHSEQKLRTSMRLCAKYDLDVKMSKIDGYSAVEVMMAEILTMK